MYIPQITPFFCYTVENDIVVVNKNWTRKMEWAKRTNKIRRSMLHTRLAVLRVCQITQSVCWPLFVAKRDVVIYFLFHGHLARHMEVHEHLRIDPAVDGLHRRIVRRRLGP